MSDPIRSIEVVNDAQVEGLDGTWDGYRLQSLLHDIYVLVSSGEVCHEDFGYLSTSDDLQDFLGADLLGLSGVECNEVSEEFRQVSLWSDRQPEALELAFVNLETSKGRLQLAAYNEHNGYYGHAVVIHGTGPLLRHVRRN